LLRFKDSITAFDGKKHDTIPKKGMVNAGVSARIFELFKEHGIRTHFIELVKPSVMKAKKLKMVPVEVVCRNIATGRLVRDYPFFKRGEKLKTPLVEFYLKNDALHDPVLPEELIVVSGLASKREVETMKKITLKTNKVLRKFLSDRGMQLVDFKLEFGRDSNALLRVGDELNIDSMRIWETGTGETKDKDVYRQGGSLDRVAQTYIASYNLIVGRKI